MKKIKGLRSKKNEKNRRCVFKKMAKNERSVIIKKWQEIKCPQSNKNGKKLTVCGHKRMPENQMSLLKTLQKIKGWWWKKNGKES